MGKRRVEEIRQAEKKKKKDHSSNLVKLLAAKAPDNHPKKQTQQRG